MIKIVNLHNQKDQFSKLLNLNQWKYVKLRVCAACQTFYLVVSKKKEGDRLDAMVCTICNKNDAMMWDGITTLTDEYITAIFPEECPHLSEKGEFLL